MTPDRARPPGPALQVAILVTRMDIGGVPDHIMTLVEGFGPDVSVTLICDHIHPDHAAVCDRLGIPVKLVPMERTPSPIDDLRTLRQIRKILSDGSYDVLHTHMSKAALLGAIIGATSAIKVVNTAHNLGFIALQQKWKRGVFWAYDKVLSRGGFDATITVSQTVADKAIEGGLFPAAHVRVIPNGIRLPRFDEAAEHPLEDEVPKGRGPLILCVARLVWFKGIDTLVNAMPAVLARHPSARLVIVGGGELREELGQQVDRLGIGASVHFTGERSDIPALLSRADMFVLPSVSEGLPISIMEAMAASLPVVATRAGGIPELVEDGQTGRIVPIGDSAGLGTAITGLLDDADGAAAFGNAGRQRLENKFSSSAMVSATEALYRELVHPHKPQEKALHA